MHFRRIAAVPLVPFDGPRQPPAPVGGRGQKRLSELGFGGTESDQLERFAVIADRNGAHMAVADDAGAKQARGTGGDTRRGPTRTVGTGRVQRVAQSGRDTAGGKQGIE